MLHISKYESLKFSQIKTSYSVGHGANLPVINNSNYNISRSFYNSDHR